ncbi:hypothetical protein [Allosphingosinicella vermicomposti]|uniref:hypothetical protein n=1 Tax=Allosphingosinicella vermicomposti TaxID=614671 RepID=UPI000D0FB0C8|nr:hypothetical protein [Allosphingosinicella vermicomposti]
MNDDIIMWAQALEDYARDWDATFENRPDYFTQEFWYLLVGCMIANWRGRPMTISAACQAMKSGSNRTREERIKRAVDDGFLVKERTADDGRATIIKPTPMLEERMRAHLERTLAAVRAGLS